MVALGRIAIAGGRPVTQEQKKPTPDWCPLDNEKSGVKPSFFVIDGDHVSLKALLLHWIRVYKRLNYCFARSGVSGAPHLSGLGNHRCAYGVTPHIYGCPASI